MATQRRAGDDRSHCFFYRAQDADRGMPVVGENDDGRKRASVLFLCNRQLDLTRTGELASRARADAGCQASCTN